MPRPCVNTGSTQLDRKRPAKLSSRLNQHSFRNQFSIQCIYFYGFYVHIAHVSFCSLSLSLWASSQICFQGQADRQTEDALSLSPSRHVDEDDERPFLLLSLSIIKAGKGRVWVEWESAKERERERERERVADLSFCCLTSCQTSSSPPLLSFI